MTSEPDNAAQVRVLVSAWGSAASVLGWSTRDYALRSGATLATLIAVLERECPRLIAARGRVRFAIGERFAEEQSPLRSGDEVAIIPPVSGGAPEDDAGFAPPAADPTEPTLLTRAPLDVSAITAALADPRAGGLALFAGVVRMEHNPAGAPLAALEYTAHESLARAQLAALADAVRKQFGLTGARVVHRLGRVAVGEASVIAATSAPHRAEALDACRVLIERLKVDVPIFKQEIWSDGGRTWVDPL